MDTEWNAIGINVIVACVIFCILQLYFCISTILSSLPNRGGSKLVPIQYSALCCYLSSSLWALSASLLFIFDPDPIEGEKKMSTTIFFTLFVLSFILSSMFIYIFMILRLYSTFKESVFKMSKISLKIHIVIVTLYPIWIIIIAVINVNAKFNSEIKTGIAVIILVIVMNISTFHLMYTFIHNLFLLILNSRQTIINIDSEDDGNKKVSQLNERQLTLLKTVTRNTVLGITMSITFTLCMTYFAISNFVEIKYKTMVRIASVWLFCIQSIILTLCIYLGFRSNEKYYNLCCSICHQKLGKLCESITEKRMNQIKRIQI